MENTVENMQLSRNDGNTVLCAGLSWLEAQMEMKKGKWVKHRFFANWEAITFLNEYGFMVLFEDGICVDKEQFEVFRFNNGDSIEEWQKNWEVCDKPCT